MTRQLLVLVCCVILSVNAIKFCPKERNGDKCRAKQNQYKCGVFFKDLTSKVPLAWLGALPEAVVRARKEGATDDDVISLLGSNVDAESYEIDNCEAKLANTRCYAQVIEILIKIQTGKYTNIIYKYVCGNTLANIRCYAQVIENKRS